MSRPRTEVVVGTAPSPRISPTDTGKCFVTGLAAKGPETPVAIFSLEHFASQFGSRQSYSVLYDWVETFFREGGAQLYVSRVLGPAAAAATVTLQSSAPAATLVVTARDKGLDGNSLNVEVQAGGAGGTFKLLISHDTDGLLETSPDLVDEADAALWSQGSAYVRVTDTGSAADPAVVATTSLSGGTDDRSSITETQWKTALDRFVRDLGPGQVAAPGRTTTQAHTDLLAHGEDNNRVPLIDLPDTSTNATLTAEVASQRALAGDTEKYAGAFAPWLYIPGLVRGTRRVVPPSALVAGLISSSDAESDPGEPAAGQAKGSASFCTGVRVEYTNTDHDTLNDAGVNVIRNRTSGPVLEGFRTMADPINLPDDWQLSQARALMAVIARSEAAAAPFLFAQVDGQRRKLAELEHAVGGELLDLFNAGALFGDTPDQAYDVDAVSENANPVSQLRNGEVRVLEAVRVSPYAELIELSITKVPITEPVA